MEENVYGRQYHKGKPISNDMRSWIVDHIKSLGGNTETGHIPRGVKTQVSKVAKVDLKVVSDVWKTFVNSNSFSPKKPPGKARKLLKDDEQYIESLKEENPCMTLGEIKDKLLQNSQNPDANVSESTISRTIKSRLDSGPWSRKKVTNVKRDKFSPANIAYAQNYLDFMAGIDPARVKFMDEAGVEMSSAGVRTYGHAPIGQKCIQLVKSSKEPNRTVNLMVGLDGTFCSVIEGASNTDQYINFIHEAITATAAQSAEQMLKPGDVLVVDNASIHRFQAERVLRPWLAQFDIDYAFTPRYAPEFDPAELCFGKMRSIFQRQEYQALISENIDVAVYDAVSEITLTDIAGFYRATGSFNV